MSDDAVAVDPLIGTIVDDQYRVLSLVGAGGMGRVYKAQHVKMNRLAAIKLLNSAYGQDTDDLKRIKREATSLTQLDHPGIVKVFSFGMTRYGEPYLALEFVDGCSLADIIARDGSLTLEQSYAVFEEMIEAIGHAHRRSVLHRDIKPSNVMILTDVAPQAVLRGHLKIVDFGLAKLAVTEGQKMTTTGTLLGTPSYMSPEQVLGRRPDARSDIYSMGCVMYECLAGHPPFSGELSLEIAAKHVSQVPEPLKRTARGEDIPPEIDAFIQKALEKKADDRYQSCSEFLRALHRALGLEDVQEEPNLEFVEESPPQLEPVVVNEEGNGDGRRKLLIFGIAGAVILLSILFLLFIR